MVELNVCSREDVNELACMYRYLREDENAPGFISDDELRNQISSFLEGDYKAFAFSDEGKTVGYALINMTLKPLYLRHFFICRDQRRKGYGREAMRCIMEYLQISEIDIEVYAWNERGLAFWKSIGFKERVYKMRLSL